MRFIMHRTIAWLLLFLTVTLGVATWLLYVSERNIARTYDRINLSYELIATSQELLLDMTDTAAQKEMHQKMQSDISHLKGLAKVTGDQQQLIDKLNTLYTSKGHPHQEIKAVLNNIIDDERSLLTGRMILNDAANKRSVHAMLMARVIAFFLVTGLLLRLNNDITRRKRTHQLLERAIREASEARQMQEQFLANMSHEIRTPMNGIKGMTDLLMDTPLTDKQRELTSVVKKSVNNLLVIIDDILDFSKIKAGRLNIEKIDFDLASVLQNVSDIFDHRLKKKALLLTMDMDPAIPHTLTGDPHRLNQILINLIGNAIKFTEKGGIHVNVSIDQLTPQEIILRFDVADSGIGIPVDSLAHIFDSFSQAGNDISRRYGGTGLGLTICRQLLHLQGGDITVSSNHGEGSVFSFHLPYAYNDAPGRLQTAPVLIQDYSTALAGRSFLVAEDNEINQTLIDHVLRKAGGEVEIAGNGSEAIEHLRNGRSFDLIIMDIQMPEMDGYAATRYIRDTLHMTTPIIAMTATAMKGEQLQCIESGMNEYMTKPFEFADLYKRINNLLNAATPIPL